MYILHAHTYKDIYNACNKINAKKQTYNKNNNNNKYNLHKKDAVIMRNAIGNCKKMKMRRRVCCHTSQVADAESIAHTRSGRKQVWCKRHSKRKKYAINRFMLDLKITRHAASATSKGAHTCHKHMFARSQILFKAILLHTADKKYSFRGWAEIYRLGASI